MKTVLGKQTAWGHAWWQVDHWILLALFLPFIALPVLYYSEGFGVRELLFFYSLVLLGPPGWVMIHRVYNQAFSIGRLMFPIGFTVSVGLGLVCKFFMFAASGPIGWLFAGLVTIGCVFPFLFIGAEVASGDPFVPRVADLSQYVLMVGSKELSSSSPLSLLSQKILSASSGKGGSHGVTNPEPVTLTRTDIQCLNLTSVPQPVQDHVRAYFCKTMWVALKDHDSGDKVQALQLYLSDGIDVTVGASLMALDALMTAYAQSDPDQLKQAITTFEQATGADLSNLSTQAVGVLLMLAGVCAIVAATGGATAIPMVGAWLASLASTSTAAVAVTGAVGLLSGVAFLTYDRRSESQKAAADLCESARQNLVLSP